MSFNSIKICIADDHQIVIDGIKGYLKNEKDIQLIGEALNAKEALKILKDNHVDILITDITMPDISGVELTRTVKKEKPDVKILALTMHNDIATISEIIQAGASGYLLKNTEKKELLEAIHKIFNNEPYYNSEIANALIKNYVNTKEKSAQAELIALTTREKEILLLIGKEYSNKKIAELLFISERTVESHRKNIFEKTNTKTIIGLIKYAYEHKLIN